MIEAEPLQSLLADEHPAPAARVQSVARAVSILMAVGQSPAGLRGSDIERQTGLPRQATYHLIHTLVTTGLLTRTAQGAYVLGLRVGVLAEGFKRQLAPPEQLAPYVRRISAETGETAYASGWWEGEIVALVASQGNEACGLPEGTHGDAHARASGKLLLALASEETRGAYLKTHPLTGRTSATITAPGRLDEEFHRIRAQGYAIDDEEFTPGLCCIAVPVDRGRLPYALTLSAPTERFRTHFARYLAAMERIAGDCSGVRRTYNARANAD